MAGWSAIAGTHNFEVEDGASAEGLAEALAHHGFAVVVARPRGQHGWVVSALDEGPYPVDALGHRTIDEVGRAAAVLARGHGGHLSGGSRCDPGMLAYHQDAPIVRTNPGARPPIPDVVVVPAPPPFALELFPDNRSGAHADLAGLDEVDWVGLGHAHGPAGDVPQLIRALARDDDQWDDVLDELFGDDLLHQGTCYSATGPAVPFVSRLVTAGGLPASRRLDLLVWLVIAAGRLPGSLLDDAGRAALRGRAPVPAPWTEEVHSAVGEQVPALLVRWDTEPPAIRCVLACLAALCPDHAGHVVEEVAAMAAAHAGHRPGVYLRLAEALLRADGAEAHTIVEQVLRWDEDMGCRRIDVPQAARVLLASHALVEGTVRIASNTA